MKREDDPDDEPCEGELTTDPSGHYGRYYRNAGQWMFVPERKTGPTPTQAMTNLLSEHFADALDQ